MRVQLWPQSLFGRLLSALLAAIGVTLVVIVVLIIRERRELSFWGSETRKSCELLEATAGSLAELPPAARAEEIERLRTSALVVDRDAEPRRPSCRRNRISLRLRRRCARGSRGSSARAIEVSVQPADRAASAVIRVGRARRGAFRGGPGGPGGGPAAAAAARREDPRAGWPRWRAGWPPGVNSTWRSRCRTAT